MNRMKFTKTEKNKHGKEALKSDKNMLDASQPRCKRNKQIYTHRTHTHIIYYIVLHYMSLDFISTLKFIYIKCIKHIIYIWTNCGMWWSWWQLYKISQVTPQPCIQSEQQPLKWVKYQTDLERWTQRICIQHIHTHTKAHWMYSILRDITMETE